MINITDNNSTIITDELNQGDDNNYSSVPCDVSIIEKYDSTFMDLLVTWLSPLVPAEIGAIIQCQYKLYKFNFTKMDTNQMKLECFDIATGLPVNLLSALPKILVYPETTILQYIATIAQVNASAEYKETLIIEEYEDKYGEQYNTDNLVINIDSTNAVDDIKRYIASSGILEKERIQHIYVNNASGQYELVSVNEIYNEMVDRGFLINNGNATIVNKWYWVRDILEDANNWFNGDERYIDETYGKNLETIDSIYILLKEGENLLFPTEYTGDNNVEMYAKDSVGTELISGSGNDTLYGGALNDNITAGSGNDTIYGGHGADEIHGGNNNDLIYGGSGNDTIYGNSATPSTATEKITSTGDEGNDYITGGTANDYLDGGEDNDVIMGGGVIKLNNYGFLKCA